MWGEGSEEVLEGRVVGEVRQEKMPTLLEKKVREEKPVRGGGKWGI